MCSSDSPQLSKWVLLKQSPTKIENFLTPTYFIEKKYFKITIPGIAFGSSGEKSNSEEFLDFVSVGAVKGQESFFKFARSGFISKNLYTLWLSNAIDLPYIRISLQF
ncbi:hypothetical protein BpHYR1_016854 [Brachionus plicatilis]|uniref:Uncharacterized protein n=1 Tax=Brachionus plicatilis TaxID=10195 RepID=A0A3M7PSX6_BRAPC|nr:hypothetical protein BpHYR1_016854 [Brachionus plicatilis]